MIRHVHVSEAVASSSGSITSQLRQWQRCPPSLTTLQNNGKPTHQCSSCDPQVLFECQPFLRGGTSLSARRRARVHFQELGTCLQDDRHRICAHCLVDKPAQGRKRSCAAGKASGSAYAREPRFCSQQNGSCSRLGSYEVATRVQSRPSLLTFSWGQQCPSSAIAHVPNRRSWKWPPGKCTFKRLVHQLKQSFFLEEHAQLSLQGACHSLLSSCTHRSDSLDFLVASCLRPAGSRETYQGATKHAVFASRHRMRPMPAVISAVDLLSGHA